MAHTVKVILNLHVSIVLDETLALKLDGQKAMLQTLITISLNRYQ